MRVNGTTNDIAVVGATGDSTPTLPAGYGMRWVYIRNNTANAVTGGIRIGTTGGGTDVVTALAVGANAYTGIAPTITGFAATATTLHIEAVTSWNSANLDIIITLDRAIP